MKSKIYRVVYFYWSALKMPDPQEILSKDIICTFATNIKYAVPMCRFSQPLFSGSWCRVIKDLLYVLFKRVQSFLCVRNRCQRFSLFGCRIVANSEFEQHYIIVLNMAKKQYKKHPHNDISKKIGERRYLVAQQDFLGLVR